MRFSVDLHLKGIPPFNIPLDYRDNIRSLIDNTLRREAGRIYTRKWGDNVLEAVPFTFSLNIPEAQLRITDSGKYIEFYSNILKLHISSHEYAFLTNLYNGFLRALSDWSPFDYPADFTNLYFHQPPRLNVESVKFKSMSPILLKCKDSGEYLTWDDDDFEEGLLLSMENIYRGFLDWDFDLHRNTIMLTRRLCRTENIFFKEQLVPATKGLIEIKAPADLLYLVYDSGLGDECGHGFGMLEVVW